MNNKYKHLSRNAANFNISSMFELAEAYKNGTNSVIDLNESQKYYSLCEDSLQFVIDKDIERPKNKLKIEKLKLINFRKFNTLDIKFEDDITIFIGDNGAGKTSILDAISRLFSYINARIIAKGRNGRPLDDLDVKVKCMNNAEVIATILLGKNTIYNGSLVRASKGIENSKTSELESLNHLSNLYRTINFNSFENSLKEISIPLLAFYSVERSSLKSIQSFDLEKLENISIDSRFDAIDKTALDGSANLDEFLKWFIFIDNLISSNKLSQEKEKIQSEIDELSIIVKDDSSFLWNTLSEKKERLNQINNILNKTNYSKIEKYRNYIIDAIISSVNSISDIYVDRTSGRAEIKIINNGIEINIFQASKGQQIYLALIADIARRLILLNPELNNPLNGQGIILIDEIELHLHPSWQQEIIQNIKSTFPNIQFIITTHSPQVLSTIPSKNIRKLDDSSISYPLAESYGQTSTEVLQQIMHVNATPNYPEKEMLYQYKNIIEQGDYKSEEADNLLKKLINILGENHPELVKLSMVKYIREIEDENDY